MFKLNNIYPLGRCRLYSLSYCRYSSNSPKNHYDVLGISNEATSDEIKTAYYEQSKQHHPDFKHGSQERFRQVNSAYEILGNPRLRKMYDKGLIFEKTPTVYEDETTSTETEERPSQLEFVSSDLNHWSKEKCTEAFAKEQKRRSHSEMTQKIKVHKEESKGITGIFFLLMLFLSVSGYIVEQKWMSEERKPKR